MKLSVKGRHLDIGDALREHVESSLSAAAEKYFSNPIEASVAFSKEAHLHRVDVSVHVGRSILLQANAEADDPYVAFDLATERVAKRLRRYKRRLKDHHRRDRTADIVPASAYVLQAEPEELPEPYEEPTDHMVIAETETEIDTLTVGEAVMRMDLAELPALLFRNAGHGRVNMVYRRADGNIGWIDPQTAHDAAA